MTKTLRLGTWRLTTCRQISNFPCHIGGQNVFPLADKLVFSSPSLSPWKATKFLISGPNWKKWTTRCEESRRRSLRCVIPSINPFVVNVERSVKRYQHLRDSEILWKLALSTTPLSNWHLQDNWTRRHVVVTWDQNQTKPTLLREDDHWHFR